MRIVYLLIGFLSFGLGLAGVVLPILPTTPFFLLAAFCFGRSSQAWQEWLQSTKVYDAYVGAYQRQGYLSPKRKGLAILYMTLLICVSLYFAPKTWLRLVLLAIWTFWTFWILLKIPHKPKEERL